MAAKRTNVSKKSEKRIPKREGVLRDYELILIINPEVGEEKTNKTIDEVSQFVTGKDGSIENVEKWGKRKLSYPLKHFMDGTYVLVRFKMQPVWGKELEARLHITEEVLRHLLLRVE